jgi:hypothetical protein
LLNESACFRGGYSNLGYTTPTHPLLNESKFEQ